MKEEIVKGFDLRRMLLPENLDWLFLAEIAFRTFFMFILLLVFFKLSGKRSIYQISLFELAIIIGLGSAAGDPMFYGDVGLLQAVIVFGIIALMYKGITVLTLRSDKAEQLLEGKTEALLINDLMVIEKLDSEAISYDEFFGFLRMRQVEHLGQVKAAYLEITGSVSIFFYPDDEVKPGLPIRPEALKFTYTTIKSDGMHSCLKCGLTVSHKAGQSPLCVVCNNKQWVRSMNSKRIT